MSIMMIVMIAFLVGVSAVLICGIFNLARGGEGSEKRSNKLMMWRVWLQGGVVGTLFIMFMISES